MAREYMVPPEANVVVVHAAGGIVARAEHTPSLIDRDHPDYVGYITGFGVVRRDIQTQERADAAARAILAQVCHSHLVREEDGDG